MLDMTDEDVLLIRVFDPMFVLDSTKELLFRFVYLSIYKSLVFVEGQLSY